MSVPILGPAMAKVTLQSIADRVGVSRMTVSNAFSRPDQLSADLRAKILAAADELGYVGPDPAARALARGRTGSVGLLINGSLSEAFEDAVSAAFLASVSDELSARGLALTLLPASSDQQFVPARDVAVDGVLVYICDPTSPDIAWLERRNVPLVVVDHNVREGIASVNVDDRGGARLAAQHLVDLGHRRVGIVTLATEQDELNHPARERMLGWRDALDAAGVDPAVVATPYHPPTQAYDAARALLDRPDRPTGVVCFSDAFALATVRAAESLGLRVPEDLSVVGFDDSVLAAASRPPLTTVRQEVPAKGAAAVAAIAAVMAGGHPEPVVLPTGLVVRESTAPPGA
ncbi:DNA-binding LacI/PurR family transcriptional regulator [Nocardioides sp. HB32]